MAVIINLKCSIKNIMVDFLDAIFGSEINELKNKTKVS